jgi:hypothetical protein
MGKWYVFLQFNEGMKVVGQAHKESGNQFTWVNSFAMVCASGLALSMDGDVPWNTRNSA